MQAFLGNNVLFLVWSIEEGHFLTALRGQLPVPQFETISYFSGD
jgi:hypothetical protein